MDEIDEKEKREAEIKAKVWSEILNAFTMKCYLEHLEKGFCSICSEPAPTLKITTELTREDYVHSRAIQYCAYCFRENIFVPQVRQTNDASMMYQ